MPPLVNPPPLYSSPPIITPPPVSRPRRNGNFWKILALLLLVGLGLSIFYNFRRVTHFFSTRQSKNIHHKKQSLEEILLEDNNAASKIAVLELNGIISSKAFDRSDENIVEAIEQQLKAAEEDKSVKAVVLKINSPGGEVLASDEINHLIADFQTRAKKPVVASMQTLAASGGYYVSVPCQWIVANDMTITGSIGVIMHGYNYRGLLTKIGVRPDTYKSGKLKDMLSGEKLPEEILPEEKEIVQELIMETYGKFTNVVATGRADSHQKNSKFKEKGRALRSDWNEFVDGRVFSGRQAYEMGFVDELGNFDTAIERAQTLAGIHNANLIEYQRPFDFGNLFRLFGKTETPALKVDLGVDFPKLQMGCLYFIYRGVLP